MSITIQTTGREENPAVLDKIFYMHAVNNRLKFGCLLPESIDDCRVKWCINKLCEIEQTIESLVLISAQYPLSDEQAEALRYSTEVEKIIIDAGLQDEIISVANVLKGHATAVRPVWAKPLCTLQDGDDWY